MVRSHSYLMGHDVLEADQLCSNSYSVKAHSSLCWELTKILDKIFCVLPAIELAQPGGKSGIKELCSLNITIEKSKLLLQHCAESSKLYLAITGKETVLRCERIRTALDQSLCRIMDMVSPLLATQIAVVVDYLRGAKFIIDSTDEEAGKSLLELLRQSDPSRDIELEAYRVAALKLNITSSIDLLIEERSVKKLIDKTRVNDEKNERKLSYLLYLLKKYGKKVGPDVNEHKENTNNPGMISDTSSSNSRDKGKSSNPPEGQPDSSITDLPPEEFCCPLSLRLMHDPVVISSGQTYERKCIEKWFEDGHDTCPKTQNRLNNFSLVPNTCMKDLIYLWYQKHVVSIHNPLFQPNFSLCHSWESSQEHSTSSSGNISDIRNNHSNISFISSETSCYSDSSLVKEVDISDDSHVEIFPWSDDYQKFQSFSNFSHDMFMMFFHRLSELPSELKGKALKDLGILLEDNDEFHCAILSNRFFDALTNFLQDAKEKSDVQALKIGAQILLSFLTNSRKRSPSSIEFQLLISFIDSGITFEVLTIVQKLTHQPNWMSHIDASSVSSIMKILESQDAEYLELALRILYNFSSHSEIKPHLSSCGCISRLTTLLNNVRLSGICVKLMRNLSDIEEAASMIAQTDGCLASIAELLETGSCEEKEHAAAIIHSLCCRSPEYCQLVMKEGIIPSLVDISINGNSEGREISMKLLQLLRDRSADFREELQLQSPMFTSGLTMNLQSESCMPNSGLSTDGLQENDRRTRPTSKSSSFFARKVLGFFSKPRSLV